MYEYFFDLLFMLFSTTFLGALFSHYFEVSFKLPRLICLLPQFFYSLVVMSFLMSYYIDFSKEGLFYKIMLFGLTELFPYSFAIMLFSSTLFFLEKGNKQERAKVSYTKRLACLAILTGVCYLVLSKCFGNAAIDYALPIEYGIKAVTGFSFHYELILPFFKLIFLGLTTLFLGALLGRYVRFSPKLSGGFFLLPELWLFLLMIIIPFWRHLTILHEANSFSYAFLISFYYIVRIAICGYLFQIRFILLKKLIAKGAIA